MPSVRLFFSALTAIFGKIGVSSLDSDLATLLRTIVIALVSAALISIRGEWRSPADLPPQSVCFLVLSGIATGFSWLCYYRALQLGPASKVAPVDKFSVVLVVIFSFAFLGEKISLRVSLGAVLLTAGAALMAL